MRMKDKDRSRRCSLLTSRSRSPRLVSREWQRNAGPSGHAGRQARSPPDATLQKAL